MILTRAFRGFTLTLIGLSLGLGSTSINAQSLKSTTTSAAVRFVPPPAPNRGVPSGRQKGGSSRGNCPARGKNQPLTALVPATTKHFDRKLSREFVWGLTVSASPTFWFYVPYSLTYKLSALFVLQDEQGNNIYQTFLTTSTKQSSIAKISLPSGTVLDVGKMYRWYFVIDCHPDAPPQVNGWVQRTILSPTLNSQLKKTSLYQRVALYAANGIWYDALTTLAQLRSANSQNAMITNDWVSLLSSVGLGAFTSEPIAN